MAQSPDLLITVSDGGPASGSQCFTRRTIRSGEQVSPGNTLAVLTERLRDMVVVTDTCAQAREVACTAELFASFGVAVFPGPYGEKGTLIPRWPDVPAPLSWDITRAWVRGIGLDRVEPGKNGVHPDQALPRLLKLLPDGVGVSRTGKGYHLFFRPARALGDGRLPEYGAELFTAGHLVNVPPSRHPSGVDYTWVIRPGGSLP